MQVAVPPSGELDVSAPLVRRRVAGHSRLGHVVRAGRDLEIVLSVGLEGLRLTSVHLEREVLRLLRAAVVVDDDLLDDERRRNVVVGDRAGRRPAVRDHQLRAVRIARGVARDARLGDRIGAGIDGQVVLAVELECLRLAAVHLEREVVGGRRSTVVVDNDLLDDERRSLVVVRDRAGGSRPRGERNLRAPVVARRVAVDSRLGHRVGARVDRQVVLAVGLERLRQTTVHGEREVLRLLRAAVVVDDDLLDDQRRRLVVVRDRARLRLADRDRPRAVCRRARLRVTGDRALGDAVRPHRGERLRHAR